MPLEKLFVSGNAVIEWAENTRPSGSNGIIWNVIKYFPGFRIKKRAFTNLEKSKGRVR
jgi:hypothetical protein